MDFLRRRGHYYVVSLMAVHSRRNTVPLVFAAETVLPPDRRQQYAGLGRTSHPHGESTGNYPNMPFNCGMDFSCAINLQTTGSTPLIYVTR